MVLSRKTKNKKIPVLTVFFVDCVHQVEWLKNDEPLRSNAGERIESIGSYSGLKIHSINFADTGAYMCQASSIGGLARDISSLVVQDDSTPSKLHYSRPSTYALPPPPPPPSSRSSD